MYALVVMASRPPEWTHDQFIAWWRGDHADLTRLLPGLRSWRHIEVERALDERAEGWDGLSILGFDSEDAMEAALASEEWQAAVRHVGPMRGRRIAVMGTEATLFPRAD